MRRPTFWTLVASLAATLLAPAEAEAQRVLRYTDHEPLGGMRTRFLKEILFPAIEKETKGRIRIEAHWDGEVADSHAVLAAIASEDKADIGVIVPEYFAQQMPMGQLFKSFLTGPSGADQVRFFRRAFDEIPAFRDELGRNGVTGIFYATGYPVGFYSTAPLGSLDGIAGQKWRTASFWHRDFLKNAGAEPVSIPWGQGVFDAMRARQIDGLMVNVDSGYMLDVHKVAPHVLTSKALWLGHVYIVAMNSKTWAGLAEEDRAAIGRATEAAYAQLGAVMDRSFDAMLGDLRAAGASVRLLTPAEVAAFADATDYRAVQARWVAGQEAAGAAGMGEVLARLRVLAEESSGR
jgi:TRAP-type C4-dicarboxylate transport system substrate-binding protein